MNKKMLLKKAAKIKLAVFDVDGVLTDGSIVLGCNGDEYKCFHVRDGQGMTMLLNSDCEIAVMTARSSEIVQQRMESLGVQYIFQNEKNKGNCLLKLMNELGLAEEQAAYIGDDIIDLGAMNIAGLPIAVADAHHEVKQNALWITEKNGGRGAVREVCELILEAQDLLQSIIEDHLDMERTLHDRPRIPPIHSKN